MFQPDPHMQSLTGRLEHVAVFFFFFLERSISTQYYVNLSVD